MPVLDLFSKRRRKAEREGQADVYRYDNFPDALKVQIVHIWNDAIGHYDRYNASANELWGTIHDLLAREKGLFQLGMHGNPQDRVIDWFVKNSEADDILDMIELSFKAIKIINGTKNEHVRRMEHIKSSADDAIEELNIRFREHGIGFQFEGEEIIRIDNQFIHGEIVKEALSLLAEPIFKKANEDFLSAHKSYRDASFKDSIVAAQRCFESTLKAICEKKQWAYQPGDRSSELIKLVRSKGLFPDYLGSGFDSYIAMMKTGLPNIRNNAGGHGDSPEAPAVPSYIAAYALHLTASNVVLLAAAMKR